MHRRIHLTLSAAALALLLSACGHSGASSGISGLRDDIKHTAKKTAPATRPHLVNECASKTKQVKHTSSSRSQGKKKTKTWYTTENYQDCTEVQHGTETYKQVVREERWCVELDDVGHNTSKDDVWYEVSRSTYGKAAVLDEGEKLTIKPLRKGC